jgi:hypothetical protein
LQSQGPFLLKTDNGTGGLATGLLNDTQVINTLWLSPDTVGDTTDRQRRARQAAFGGDSQFVFPVRGRLGDQRRLTIDG